jgi:hypothetical protein
MSISTGKNQEPEITRSPLIKKASISKAIQKTAGIIESNPISMVLVFGYLITGVSELLGNEMSWKWYLALLVITSIFTVDKFRKTLK